MTPPMPIPIAPPTRVSPSHTSMLCAQPPTCCSWTWVVNESEIRRDLLVSMGCQFGQGYLLAMPMAANQAETLARIGSHQIPSLPRQAPDAAKPTLSAPG
jgi:hypothetical protein